VKNALKILYIFIAGIGVFFINNLYVLLGIITFHFILFFLIKNKQKSLNFLSKIKWFILIIFLFHAFSGENDIIILKIKHWILAISYDGTIKGLVMASKLVGMLLITQVVRLSMSRKEFVKGMTSIGLSQSSAEIIDQIILIVSEQKGGGNGNGGGKRNAKNNKDKNKNQVQSKDVLFKGKVGNIPKRLLEKIHYATDQFSNNSNAIVASSALSLTLIRMVKIAPGLPLAPGHKNILMFPVLIYGVLKSKKKAAGLQIGFISGVLHFTMGFGKYGPLGILQFALLGWVFDLILKLPFKKDKLLFLMFVGAFGGIFRVSTEIILAFAFGMPNAFYLLYLPYIISQIAFGIASGFISKAIIKTTENEE